MLGGRGAEQSCRGVLKDLRRGKQMLGGPKQSHLGAEQTVGGCEQISGVGNIFFGRKQSV